MDRYIILQIIILLISTSLVINFVFATTKPKWLQKNKKLKLSKMIVYSIGISIVFTSIITIISLNVDKKLIKNK